MGGLGASEDNVATVLLIEFVSDLSEPPSLPETTGSFIRGQPR